MEELVKQVVKEIEGIRERHNKVFNSMVKTRFVHYFKLLPGRFNLSSEDQEEIVDHFTKEKEGEI